MLSSAFEKEDDNMKRMVGILLVLLMLLACLAAGAETAAVATPGGWLNMRSEPSAKARVLKRIPNRSTLTYVESVDDTWSLVTYDGTTGYVQTAYLNLVSTAAGKTLYADNTDAVYLRAAADDDAGITACLDASTPLYVVRVEGEWAVVCYTDEAGAEQTGYLRTVRIAQQYSEPQPAPGSSNVNEAGVITAAQKLYERPDRAATVTAELEKDTLLVVLVIEGGWCRVVTEQHTGYVPVTAVRLTGEQREMQAPEEAGADNAKLTERQARSIANDALEKVYEDFHVKNMKVIGDRYMAKRGFAGPLYEFAYYQGEKYVYCAVVHAVTGEVLYTADYTGFRQVVSSDTGSAQGTQQNKPASKPQVTAEPEQELSQSAARSRADQYLAGRYPDFSGAQIASVRCRYATEDGSFDTPYYQFDYFTADGQLAYEIMIHAPSGRVLYVYGDLPGEGNG